MNNIHQNYVSHFIEVGTQQLFDFGYTIEADIIDGSDGVTSINLISRTNPESNKVVRFAYNRLDYNLGVIVYGTRDGKIDFNQMLLPQIIQTADQTYGYMGQNMPNEVKRLIDDICKKLV